MDVNTIETREFYYRMRLVSRRPKRYVNDGIVDGGEVRAFLRNTDATDFVFVQVYDNAA